MSKQMRRIHRESWDVGRSSRSRFITALRYVSRDMHTSSLERLAAGCILHSVTELWYGYYPSEPHHSRNRSQERRDNALADIERGGIDLWLSVLNLPIDLTLRWILSLNPSKTIPPRVDTRGTYDREKYGLKTSIT